MTVAQVLRRQYCKAHTTIPVLLNMRLTRLSLALLFCSTLLHAADPVVPAVPATKSTDGKTIFDNLCHSCHTAGIAGAPKVGDKAEWAARIAQGADTLDKHAIEGFTGKTGVMPAKGGNPALTDEQMKAVVAWMIEQSK